MSLDKIRELIARRNIPPELIGKVETLCIEVYEYAEATLRKKRQLRTNPAFSPNQVVEYQRLPAEQVNSLIDARRTSPFALSISRLTINENILVPYCSYDGSQFASYAHNTAINYKFKIKVQSSRELGGWIITRIA